MSKEEEEKLSSIALLIDDISNEDPNIKLNSFKRLVTIAEVLGENRTYFELVPLLVEVIEKIEDNSELLVTLCDQLGEIAAKFHTSKYICSSELLKILESTSSNDDSDVRIKACAVLGKIATLLNDEELSESYMPIVKRLCKGDLFPQKIAGCLLIPTCYTRIDSVTQALLLTMYIELSKDDTPMVRRAAASVMGKMVQMVNQFQIKSDVLPLFQALVNDQQDAVKVAVIESSVEIFKLCKAEEISEFLLPSIKQCSEDKKSWRLRYIIAEQIGILSPFINAELISANLLPIVNALLLDSEHEVRSALVMSLQALVIHSKKEDFAKLLLPILAEKTIKDTSEYVRISLAKVAGTLCKELASETTKPQLFAIVNSLLSDDNSEVRINTMKNLQPMLSILNSNEVVAVLVPAIQQPVTDKRWRVRLSALQYICSILSDISVEVFRDKILPLFLPLLKDPVYQIRNDSTLALAQIKKILGDEWFCGVASQKIESTYKDINYNVRKEALFTVKLLYDKLPEKYLKEKILPLMVEMGKDIVPNIRLNVAKILELLSTKVALTEECINIIKGMLTDADFDVKYFATNAFSKVNT